MAEFWKALTRHLVTIGIILSAGWWLITPRAEEFVREAVNDRITRVEVSLDLMKEQLDEVIRRLERMEDNQDQVIEDDRR